MTGTPSQAHRTGPRGDGQPESDPTPTPDHERAALDAIQEARTTGGTQGTTYALTAIAHAILARTENP